LVKGLNDRNFVFPHCGDILQLEESAAAGCTMCAQFLQSQSSDEVLRAKDEMKQHWSASFDLSLSSVAQGHNLDTFRKRIPEELLSQTLKDAIVIARELGLLYIWINSLCILQDDTDDWLLEAATMSSVYGGSSLNIAASGAPDGNFGCFLRPEYTLQCQIQVESGCRAVRYRCVPGGMYYYSLADMPLTKRGWTLQERLLPSRTLHFTSTQVFWECYQQVACETFPEQEFLFPEAASIEIDVVLDS
jgi:hypothetical protein